METPLLDKLYAEGQGPGVRHEPPCTLEWKGMKWNLDAHGNVTAYCRENGNRYALWPKQAEVYIQARLDGKLKVKIGIYTYVC